MIYNERNNVSDFVQNGINHERCVNGQHLSVNFC